MAAKTYDVCIVGYGAAGGVLSAHLARPGVAVAALPFAFPNRHIPTIKPGKEGFDSERSRADNITTRLKQETRRAGLALVRQTGKPERVLLTEWSQLRERAGPKSYQLTKNLPADGYYTFYTGLIEELGCTGNTVRAAFPASTIAEH